MNQHINKEDKHIFTANKFLLLGIFILGLFAVACGPTLTPPSGYVKMKSARPHDFKAVSAQGHTIAVNEEDNEDESAGIEFWSAAIEHQLVDMDGLTLVGRSELHAKKEKNREGVLFRFEVGERPHQLLYLVGIYVTPDEVYTLEAVGPLKEMEAQSDDLVKSFESIEF